MSSIKPNENIFLRLRHCIEIPTFYNDVFDEYLPVVYNLIQKNVLSVPYRYVLGCFSRSISPSCVPRECIIIDFHYVVVLSNLAAWYRTHDNRYLDSLYCKVLENNCLYKGDYYSAAFFHKINQDTITVNDYSGDDLVNALFINLIAIMHESAHAMTDFQEFIPLFDENIMDYIKSNPNDIKREGKCDLFSLIALLSFDTKELFLHTPEEMIDLYFHMLMANYFCSTFPTLMHNRIDIVSLFQPNIDRMLTTLDMLRGLALFPDLNWEQILTLKPVHRYLEGLRYIGSNFLPRLADYITQYETIPKHEIENAVSQIKAEEKSLATNSLAYIYPDKEKSNF